MDKKRVIRNNVKVNMKQHFWVMNIWMKDENKNRVRPEFKTLPTLYN